MELCVQLPVFPHIAVYLRILSVDLLKQYQICPVRFR